MRAQHRAFLVCVVGFFAATQPVCVSGKVCGEIDLFSKSTPEERIPAICDTLKLNKMVLGDDGMGAIAAELKGNTAVTRLWVDGCSIRATGIGWLGKLLKEPDCNLREVHIDSNNFGPNGVRWLSQAIAVNTGLRELSMRWNTIRTAEAKVLADAIKVNKGIKVLKVHGNLFGDGGASAFAEALLTNNVLEVIMLGSNNIGDAGAALLAASMEVNTAITELALIPSENIKNKQYLKAIHKASAVNKAKDSEDYQEKLRTRGAVHDADDHVVNQIQARIDAFNAENCLKNPRDCRKQKAADPKEKGVKGKEVGAAEEDTKEETEVVQDAGPSTGMTEGESSTECAEEAEAEAEAGSKAESGDGGSAKDPAKEQPAGTTIGGNTDAAAKDEL